LILSMFSYDPKKRPTVEELKNHPWMKKPMSHKLTRQTLIDKLQEKRSCKTADSSREANETRAIGCDPMLEFVRQVSDAAIDMFKFNDMTDHDIDVAPSVIWEELRAFNEDVVDGKMNLEQNVEKRHFLIEVPEENLKVKVKFLELKNQDSEEDEDQKTRLRIRFVRKQGDISKWYSLFEEMKEANFSDILLAPR